MLTCPIQGTNRKTQRVERGRMNRITLSLLSLGLVLIAGTAYVLEPTPAPTLVDVDRPVVASSTPTPDVSTAKLSVTRLTPEPEQVLILNDEVNYATVDLIISQIVKLENDYDDLYLLLDSPGGSVFDGSRLISYIEGSKARIHTVNINSCASMCAQIFQHGKTRYSLDRATLMFHPAAGGVRGTVHEMKSLLAYVDLETRKLDAYVADRAKIPRSEFDAKVLKNVWIASDDAIKLGLVDKLAVVSVSPTNPETFNVASELKKLNKPTKSKARNRNPLSEIY